MPGSAACEHTAASMCVSTLYVAVLAHVDTLALGRYSLRAIGNIFKMLDVNRDGVRRVTPEQRNAHAHLNVHGCAELAFQCLLTGVRT